MRLFPTYNEMGALAVLLLCQDGWNMTSLTELDIPDQYPNADYPDDGSEDGEPVIYRVALEKHRRPVAQRHTSNNLVDVGRDSPGRAMRQALAITDLARESLGLLGRPTNRLLVSRRIKPEEDGAFNVAKNIGEAIEAWAKTAKLAGESGGVLEVSGAKIRRTGPVRRAPAQYPRHPRTDLPATQCPGP
jgi:hypothetical protein